MTAERTDLPAELELRLHLEELLADVAARFLDLPSDQVDVEIGRAQRRLCDLLGFDRSTMWQLPRPDCRTLELLSVVHPSDLPQPSPRMDAGVHFPYCVGRLLEGQPVILTTLADLPAEAEADRESHRHFGTKSSAMFPLRVGGRVFGAVAFATTRAEREWPAPVVRRLELIAQIFASALARKDADAELRVVSGRLIHAQEKERARLAQELHDGLSQQLAVLAVELDLLGQRLPATPAETQACMNELSARTKALSADVHRLSHGLHPAKLQQLGLVAAVRGFCRDLETSESVQVQFSGEGVVEPLPDDVALSLYRIAQEALRNVVKHSGARHAAVTLTETGAEIRLDITDDGCGFDPAATTPADSLGLLGMRERAGMVGGQIHWEPAPGGGTTVRVQIPLPPRVPA